LLYQDRSILQDVEGGTAVAVPKEAVDPVRPLMDSPHLVGLVVRVPGRQVAFDVSKDRR
jgi:hypothetical protein